MSKTISRMTHKELQELIDSAVAKKLAELLADPDWGLTVRKKVRTKLLRQMKSVANGRRGRPLEEVLHDLGLE